MVTFKKYVQKLKKNKEQRLITILWTRRKITLKLMKFLIIKIKEMKFYNKWFHNLKVKSNKILIKTKFLRKKINCKLIEDKQEAIFRIMKKKRISLKIKT